MVNEIQDQRQEQGASAEADRAGGPTDLSRDASQPKALIPSAERVIFLDIDGPMIPCAMYLIDHLCSIKRMMSPPAVAVLKELCKRTGAKVVFNTTHNSPTGEAPDIEVALQMAGLPAECIHPTAPKTRYPSLPRDLAVKEWLAAHPGADWIALDDVKFTDDPRLILIHPDEGLHTGHLNDALEHYGERPCVFLV